MEPFLSFFNGEYLYSIAAVFSMAAYIFSNILWLRVFLIVAAVLYIISGVIMDLTSMAGWNFVYLLINLYHTGLLLLNKSTVLLPDEIKDVYKSAFTSLTTREFKKLIMMNPFETLSHERVISEGETTNKLFFLLSGEASVWKAGKSIASISPGDFIGEMSFMSNQFASADVNANNTIRVAYWTHDDLNKLNQKNNRIYNKFLNIVGCDLVKKLNRNNDQLIQDNYH